MLLPTKAPDYSTVTSSSQLFTASLSPGVLYLLTTTTACFITQGDGTAVASAAAGSHLVPAGGSMLLSGDLGARVAIIRDSADGKATLSQVRSVFY